jgi:tetratricopeptide (TPR) repeat protein
MVKRVEHPGGFGVPENDENALERAALALRNNWPREAEHLAAEFLKSDPRNFRALYIFGCALLIQGRAQEALAPLESAARGARGSESDTQLAVALRQVGRPEDALSRLKRATKRQPPYAPAFYELGCLLSELDRDEEAIETFRRGIEIAPIMPGLSIQLGYAHLRRREVSAARAAFAHALDILPESADALFGMGKAHQEVGENDAAAGFFRRYLAIRPDDAGALITYGHCLLELGQLDAGYGCFRTAARGGPKRYARALGSLIASGHGRFWLKPSAAARYLLEPPERPTGA